MAKKDTLAKRFKQYMAASLALKERDALGSLMRGGEPKPPPTDWSNVALRAQVANEMLSMPEGEHPLSALFKEFKLDPANPFSWNTIINSFAWAYAPRPAGRKTEWSHKELCQLLSDFDQVRHERTSKNPALTDEIGVCKALVSDRKRFPRYAGKKGESIAKKLAAARDPTKNETLKYYCDEGHKVTISLVLDEGKGKGLRLPKDWKDRNEKFAVQYISEAWRRKQTK